MATTRNSQIATIKIAAKQLGMDDDTYRAMLQSVAGKRSAADLDWGGRQKVIDHLKKIGAVIRPGKKTKGRPHNLALEPYLQKIEALLADMGLSWAYAETIAQHITGGKKPEAIQRLAWVREEKHFKGIVTALVKEQEKRSGLEAIDHCLQKLGETRDDVAKLIASRRPGYSGNWMRDGKMLDALGAYYHERVVAAGLE